MSCLVFATEEPRARKSTCEFLPLQSCHFPPRAGGSGWSQIGFLLVAEGFAHYFAVLTSSHFVLALALLVTSVT